MKYHHFLAIGITGMLLSFISTFALPNVQPGLRSIGMTLTLLAIVLAITEWLNGRSK